MSAKRSRFGVKERILFDGTLLEAPDSNELARLAEAVRESKAESVAVSLLFSFANPVNERAVVAELKKQHLDWNDKKAKPIVDKFHEEHPAKFATVEQVADHIDHVKNLVGIDHVGLGSDFDGVGDTMPSGLKDVAQYPNLLRVLLERGYTEQEIEKICSGNALRVWQAVIDFANQAGADASAP